MPSHLTEPGVFVCAHAYTRVYTHAYTHVRPHALAPQRAVRLMAGRGLPQHADSLAD